jgi:hypothetical protein
VPHQEKSAAVNTSRTHLSGYRSAQEWSFAVHGGEEAQRTRREER